MEDYQDGESGQDNFFHNFRFLDDYASKVIVGWTTEVTGL